jgi:hypothetical protein
MGCKIMEVNKFSAFLMSFVCFALFVYIIINGSFSLKGVYIDGILAYVIGFIDFILGVVFFYFGKKA